MEAPYPGEEQKFILSQKTGLELQQVSYRIQALAIDHSPRCTNADITNIDQQLVHQCS